jgi:hypothetical protein
MSKTSWEHVADLRKRMIIAKDLEIDRLREENQRLTSELEREKHERWDNSHITYLTAMAQDVFQPSAFDIEVQGYLDAMQAEEER